MKQKAAHPPGPNPQRGWSGIGVESTASLYGEQTERPTGELKDEKVVRIPVEPLKHEAR